MLPHRHGFVAHNLLFDFLAPRFTHTTPRRVLTRSLSSTSTSTKRKTSRSSVKSPRPTALPRLEQLLAHDASVNSKLDTLVDKVDHTEFEAIQKDLSALRHCVNENDVQGAWNYYIALARRPVSVIAPPQLEGIERLVMNASAGLVKNYAGAWTAKQETLLANLALASASGGYRGALWTLMVRFINDGRADDALLLYKTDFEQNQKAKSVAVQEPEEESIVESLEEYELPVEVDKTRHSEQGGRMDALLLAIAAHASRGSFHDALRACLDQPGVKFIPGSVSKLMRSLSDKGLQDATLQYLSKLVAVRYVRFPHGLDVHLANLTRDRADKSIHSICQSILEGFHGPTAWLAPSEELVTPERPLYLPERNWATFLTGLIVSGRPDLAKELWGNLIAVGVQPVVALWNGLFEGYRRSGSLERLLNSWDAMKKSGVEPDAYSHCTKITALFERRKQELAMAAFTSYRQTTDQADKSVAVYNAVLRGFLFNHDLAGAQTVWNDMVANGPQPDIISFNTVLRYHMVAGDLNAMGSVLIDLGKSGLKPDSVTFTCTFSAMLKAGKVDAASRLRDLMKAMNVEENTVTYSTIIRELVQRDQLDAAWSLLKEMDQTPHAQPNEVTYSTILSGINKSHAMGYREGMDMGKEVLKRMLSHGVKPNRTTYQLLINICLKYREPEGLNSALELFRAMKQRRIPWTHNTWFVMLRGVIAHEAWDVAAQLVDEMAKVGFRPTFGVWDLVAKIRARTQNP